MKKIKIYTTFEERLKEIKKIEKNLKKSIDKLKKITYNVYIR